MSIRHAPTETRHTARNLLALARPSFMFLVVSFALMGVARSGDAADNRIGFLVVATVAGWSLFAATLNDIGDTDVDRANLGHTGTRPLAYGRLERPVVAATLAASLAVTVACSLLLSWRSLVAVGCGIVLVAAYSLKPFKLSSRGVLTSMLLPAGYVVVPFLTGRFATGATLTHADTVLVTPVCVVHRAPHVEGLP